MALSDDDRKTLAEIAARADENELRDSLATLGKAAQDRQVAAIIAGVSERTGLRLDVRRR